MRAVTKPRALVGATLLLIAAGLSRTAPAGAHARIVGSDPADGAVVDHAPERITLLIDNKPATIEGDPLRVYGPDGRRVDNGLPAVSDDGHQLSIGLDIAAARPAGRYHVVYRLVSADTHLIAGRIEFEAREAAPASTVSLRGADAEEHGRLLHGWRTEPWPAAMVTGVFVLLLFRGGRRRPQQTAYVRRVGRGPAC